MDNLKEYHIWDLQYGLIKFEREAYLQPKQKGEIKKKAGKNQQSALSEVGVERR